MRRIAEGVTIAVISSGITWAFSDRSALGTVYTGMMDALAGAAPGLEVAAWMLAGVLAALAGLTAARSWRRADPEGVTFWEFDLVMPSWLTVWTGAAITSVVTALGLGLAADGSTWGLVLLCCAAAGVLRFLTRLGRALNGLFA